MKFIDSSGSEIGSTALGRQILAAAVPSLSEEIYKVSNWRKDYLPIFGKVAIAEQQNSKSAFEVAAKGLAAFEQSVVTDQGDLLIDVVRKAWRSNKSDVAMVLIRGTGARKVPLISGEDLVREHLAEPEILSALETLNLDSIQDNLLIALAGGAEYSPARTWLDWGGSVAVVARARPELWRELIARARAGAGTLYVPVLRNEIDVDVQKLSDEELANVAGLDLVSDASAIAGWLSMLARTEAKGLVLGSYAYAPGSKHIEVQAIQHCLGKVMTESLPKSRVSLTWLATPTDSYVVSKEFEADISSRYESRSVGTRLRDVVFGVSRHKPRSFRNEEGVDRVLIDSTSSLQGPSYALAKRVQRWMAYIQLQEGRNVAYLVSPPARTDSVLSTKILNATYAGAPKFGLVPFDVVRAVELETALLLAALGSPKRQSSISVYQDLAVHGGLWRLIYSPKTVWRAATLRGILHSR